MTDTADPMAFSDDEAADEGLRQRTRRRHQRNGYDAEDAQTIRFQFDQFSDIKIDAAPPYLIDQMIPRVGVVVVWGKPKSGKTFWVFDLEMHIALG